jgi:hypothetical protein
MRSALAFCRQRKLVCAVGGGDAFTSIAVFKGFTFAMDPASGFQCKTVSKLKKSKLYRYI